MSETTNAHLRRAYALIENDEREKAEEVLAPLLEEEADNAHLWWVYTHAAQDLAVGQAALERVLELDPKYPGASELKADFLEAQAKDPDLIALEADEAGGSDSATPLDIDDWEDLQPIAEADAEGSSARVRLVLALALLIVIAGGALVISGAVDVNALLSSILTPQPPQVVVISGATGEPAPAPIVGDADPASAAATAPAVLAGTIEAGESDAQATASPTAAEPTASPSPEATATVTPPPEPTPTIDTTAEGIASFVSALADEIDDFAIDPSMSGTLPTELGATLVVHVCAIPGPQFNERLSAVLNAVVALAQDLPETLEAVAAGLINCDDPEADLRLIGVARGDIDAFANDEIEAKDFQRAWQPLS